HPTPPPRPNRQQASLRAGPKLVNKLINRVLCLSIQLYLYLPSRKHQVPEKMAA
uniref:Transposase n=1 Tax=Mesocestoides corti TaxID=53468 RepID=A0A5K3FVG9_MESCO